MASRIRPGLILKGACLSLFGAAVYVLVALVGSGCGGTPLGLVKVTPTGTGSATPSATPTPGQLSGDVLIIGGINRVGNAVAQAELYDPTSGLFSSAGTLNQARAFHTATLLNNVTVLIAGGQTGGGTVLKSAELYSSTSQTFTSTTGQMLAARTLHTATLLNNGQVLITGGTDQNGVPLKSAELYDPASQTFTAAANMNFARAGHTATLLADGRVLIAGGFSNAAMTTLVAQAEIYNPNTNSFTVTGSLSDARYFHTATLIPSGPLAGQVLIAGGHDAAGVTTTAEVYDPGTSAFSAGGIMTIARAEFASALLPNGLVLLCGGLTNNPNVITVTAELYNPGSRTSGQTGNMTVSRHFQTATAFTSGPLAGQILVVGGQSGTTTSTALASAELYNPGTNGFSSTGTMANSRFGHSASLFP